MVVKEGMVCPMPGSITPVTWPPVPRDTLRELESFGYDYLYVGKGHYRVWVKRAHKYEYLDADGINALIDNEKKKAARAQRKQEKQQKKDATKGKASSKRRRRS
jgi:hypothetical protein